MAVRSAGDSGSSRRCCTRRTAGSTWRSSRSPSSVRCSRFTRRSCSPGVRSSQPFASSRSSTPPRVERSKAIRWDSRVASTPGFDRTITSAAYCTEVRSNTAHSSANSAVLTCCARRIRWPGMS